MTMKVQPAIAADDAVATRVLHILRDVAGDDEVLADPELSLYGSGLLDSLATVTLMVELEQQLGVRVSPAEFDREAWATPRALVMDVTERLARAGRR